VDSFNQIIRKITQTGTVTTIAGRAGYSGAIDGVGSAARFNYPRAITADLSGNLYVSDTQNNIIRKITSNGKVTTLAVNFNFPMGIVTDSSGNIYVAEFNTCVISKIASDGTVTVFTGEAYKYGYTDGIGSNARFNGPSGIAIDVTGNLYVADYSNNMIRKITQTRDVTNIAGVPWNTGSTDGIGSNASFNRPLELQLIRLEIFL
jgi:streptogramin lyase